MTIKRIMEKSNNEDLMLWWESLLTENKKKAQRFLRDKKLRERIIRILLHFPKDVPYKTCIERFADTMSQ